MKSLFVLSGVIASTLALTLRQHQGLTICQTLNSSPSPEVLDYIGSTTTQFNTTCNVLFDGHPSDCSHWATEMRDALLDLNPCKQVRLADEIAGDIRQSNHGGNDNPVFIALQVYLQEAIVPLCGFSAPYCIQPSQDPNILGFFPCQFQSELGKPVLDVSGTSPNPPGFSGPLPIPGSCSLSPNGPIPDGNSFDGISVSGNPIRP